jgi:hypothetical protein
MCSTNPSHACKNRTLLTKMFACQRGHQIAFQHAKTQNASQHVMTIPIEEIIISQLASSQATKQNVSQRVLTNLLSCERGNKMHRNMC